MSAESRRPGDHEDAGLLARLREAIADDLAMLADLHAKELNGETVAALKETRFPLNLGLKLRTDQGHDVCETLARVLADLSDPVGQDTLDGLAVDYADIYLTYALRASPNESVWLDDDNLERQEPMFEVRAYYREHGLAVADWRMRPDDNLVHQLQFVAHLLGKEAGPSGLHAAAMFMDKHLLRWIWQFAARVAARCATPFYASFALLTATYLDELRDVLADLLEEPRPPPEDVAKRDTQHRHNEGSARPATFAPRSG